MSDVTKKEGQLVQITQKETSALQDPFFEHNIEKVKLWLSTSKTNNFGREMDNVNFNDERFELMVDTRGYKPEDVKCTVCPNLVEIVAQKQESSNNSQRNMATTRSYQLPQNVLPQQAICCISSEGILMIAVPWQK